MKAIWNINDKENYESEIEFKEKIQEYLRDRFWERKRQINFASLSKSLIADGWTREAVIEMKNYGLLQFCNIREFAKDKYSKISSLCSFTIQSRIIPPSEYLHGQFRDWQNQNKYN